MDAIPITKITANPIPSAVSVFLDTPRNGQIPKNLIKTKLLASKPPITMANIIEPVLMFPPPSYYLFQDLSLPFLSFLPLQFSYSFLFRVLKLKFD